MIDPDECIDCAVCIPECPTNAIMAEEDVPEDQQEFIALNAELARVWPSITRMKPHTDEAEKWRDVLCENGMLFFEVGIGQADSVLRIMRSSGFGDIQIVKDLNNIPRVVYGTRVETI